MVICSWDDYLERFGAPYCLRHVGTNEDGISTFLRIICNHLPDYTAPQSIRPKPKIRFV
jgi:hypothetical protein